MAEVLENKTFLRKSGNELKEVNAEEAVKDVQMVAYYFGAKWCSDCEKFTLLLKDFYNKMKSDQESFEVIYISSDKTEEEMTKFVKESHGDWLVFYLDESDDESKEFEAAWALRDMFGVRGVPTLIVVNNKTQFSTMDGVTDLVTKGASVFKEWKENSVEPVIFDDGEEIQKEEGRIYPNCCKISKFKPWISSPPIEILAGKTLLRKSGKEFKEESLDVTLANADLVGFYFSASWCGPCHRFTPILKKCYEALKAENKSFEVVFVPLSETDEDMRNYMQDLHGNWLVTSCDESVTKPLARKFAVEGIPYLVIINKRGEMVSTNGEGDVVVKGSASFPLWLEGKPGVTSEEERLYWEQMEDEEESEVEAAAAKD
uniref:Nucleoredoxin n=1 Tax=Hemiscolopendra marginata TaxID=943146 RepID=A0A646QC98_9MYRI